MRIGITGGHGFIGRNLASEFIKKGWKVSFFDRPQNDLLNPNQKRIKDFVLKNDVIFHAAAVNRGTNTEIISGSVVATYNLISAMEKNKSKTKIVFLSSVQAEIDTLYGKSKRLAEIMFEEFSKRNRAPVTVFRITNVFGEGCKPFYNSVVATFCYQIANNQEIKINVDKKMRLIYIKDLARILAKEAAAKKGNKFYLKTISSKNEIAVSQLAKLINSFKKDKKSGTKSKLQKDLYNTYLSYLNYRLKANQ